MRAPRERVRLPRPFVLLSLGLFGLSAGTAHAQTKEECVTAFDEGQERRETLELRKAREHFLLCSREACPALVRADCAQALDGVQRSMPTVSLGALDEAGHDIPGVRVTIDGEPLAQDPSGQSLSVDPGKRRVRFEHERYEAIEREVVFRMGERNRVLVVTMRAAASSDARAEGAGEARRASSSVSPWFYVLGGVGVAGLGGFTYFALSGASEKDRLRGTCAPFCTSDEVSGLRTRYIAADVSLGIGLVALGAAAYFLLFHGKEAPPVQHAR